MVQLRIYNIRACDGTYKLTSYTNQHDWIGAGCETSLCVSKGLIVAVSRSYYALSHLSLPPHFPSNTNRCRLDLLSLPANYLGSIPIISRNVGMREFQSTHLQLARLTKSDSSGFGSKKSYETFRTRDPKAILLHAQFIFHCKRGFRSKAQEVDFWLSLVSYYEH